MKHEIATAPKCHLTSSINRAPRKDVTLCAAQSLCPPERHYDLRFRDYALRFRDYALSIRLCEEFQERLSRWVKCPGILWQSQALIVRLPRRRRIIAYFNHEIATAQERPLISK